MTSETRFNVSAYLPFLRLQSLIKAIVYALLLGGTYYTMLVYLLHLWENEDFSHCYLIPFLVLYLIWEKREKLVQIPSAPSWIGLIPTGIAISFFWLGELGGEYFTLNISFWFVIIGLLWLHFGWEKIKTIWFALIMVLTMFPFPHFINTRITFQLRLISSKLGVWMLHLYGMSAYREGNVIDLGFTQLQVVDACSGLRYVMPLMVLSLLLAYWFKAYWWKRVTLFLSSIPLAIFVNSFRIAATGVLYSMFGAQVAEGFFHGFSGWLIFMFAIPFLLFEMWVLRRFPPAEHRESRNSNRETEDRKSKENEKVVEATRNGRDNAEEDKRETQEHNAKQKTDNSLKGENVHTSASMNSDPRSAFRDPRFIAAVVLLLLTFGLSHGIEFRQKVPIAKPFSQFPLQIGEWRGAREDMEQQFLDVLKFSDYVMVDYTNQAGKSISLYVAYYQDQRKGESIHSPETCLPAGGWEFREAGAAVVPLAGGKSSMTVNRAFIEKSGEKQLTYYWFPMRGRVLTKLYQLKIYTFWDSLTKQRTDGALVRVITPVMQSEKLADAEARLQGFAQKIGLLLDEYVPK